MLLSLFSPFFIALALFTSLHCAHSFKYSCIAFVLLCSVVLAVLHLQHLCLRVVFAVLHLQCLCLWCYAYGASFSMPLFIMLCSYYIIFDTCIWLLIGIWSFVSVFFKHMLFKNFHHLLPTLFFCVGVSIYNKNDLLAFVVVYLLVSFCWFLFGIVKVTMFFAHYALLC